MAKKGNLLSGEQALAAAANFDIAERLVVLQSSELAQAMKQPNQIGNSIRPEVLENEISKLCNAQKEVLARGPKEVPHNAQKEVLARGPKEVPHNAQQEVLARGPKEVPHNAQQEVLARGPKEVPHNAQKEVLARGPIIVPYNALVINSASKVMEAFNTSLSNVAKNHALNQSQNIGLGLAIGNVISETAAANNSEKLNRGPKIEH